MRSDFSVLTKTLYETLYVAEQCCDHFKFKRGLTVVAVLNRYPVIGSKIGDMVYVRGDGKRKIGIIRYIGPIGGTEDATHFGIEFVVGFTSYLPTLVATQSQCRNIHDEICQVFFGTSFFIF